jgi:hypothetical protein
MTMENMRAYTAVQKWIDNVNRYYHLNDDEWEGRLQTLRVFCQHVGQDPDTMIGEALDIRQVKITYLRRLKQVAQQLCPSPHAAHDWENVVRSFFIHNGARVVVRPYPE